MSTQFREIARRFPTPARALAAPLASLLLGAVAATGFAPLEWWPLTLLAMAAWMALIHAAPSFRASMWRGWTFGVGHFTVNNNWFQHAFDFQDAMPPVLGYFAAVALALYLAVYPMAAAGIAWRFRRREADAAWVLLFGAAWIATEWLRAVLFTGYAWDPLAAIWLPVIGIARTTALIGTYALSGLTIVAAGALLLLPGRRWTLPAIVAAGGILAGVSAMWTDAPVAPADAPRVRIVQPDIGNEERGEEAGERSLAELIRLSGRPGPVPRLVVWPEGLVYDLLEDGYPRYIYAGRPGWWTRGRIAAVLGPRDTLMTNAPTLAFDATESVTGAGNSVLAIGPDARIAGRYDKAHLVPYGEYLPMPWLLKPLGLARLVPGGLDFTPGPGPRSIAWPGVVPVGIQVCYEIVFSGEVVDEARRPRLLFNPSNDAWFGSWGPPQHLAQARLRAIEEGLPIVRATPTGISALIAADGRLLATIPHRTAGAIELPLPPALRPTVFARVGNLMAAVVAVALATLAIAIRGRGR